MTKDSEAMVSDGEILELLPDGNYKISIYGADFEVKAYKGGKMKKNHIKLLPGDRVQVELNPYEISKGRIIYRYKRNPYEEGGSTNNPSAHHSKNTRRASTSHRGSQGPGSRNTRPPYTNKKH